MSAPIARRTFLAGLSTVPILGFDPVHRTWVTSALAETPAFAIPHLDGVLVTDAASLATYADDYGHIVHHTPLAALKPGSVEDVVRAVSFCRRHHIAVAARGQGHSTAGQAQVDGGLVIDMSTLNEIEAIGTEHATVQGGLVWKDLLVKSIPLGLSPPVLTGFVGLSVGGTLSMGGVGAASFRHGAQVDHVLELEVVTGEGELIVCSTEKEPLLFQAALGGVGQYGIIVRAKIKLEPVLPNARNYVITYTSLSTFLEDVHTLMSDGKVDGVYGQIGPDGQGGWVYVINANKFFATASPPDDADVLSGLQFPPAALQATNLDTLSFDTLVDSLIAFLQSLGLTDIPHVWGDTFLPESQIHGFVESSLAGISTADLGPAGFILLFPIRNKFPKAPTFRLPKSELAFLFDVLGSGSPADPSYATTGRTKARARFEAARALGGTLYPIGSTPMSTVDWIRQYGALFPLLLSAKRQYDPANIMAPGVGIF